MHQIFDNSLTTMQNSGNPEPRTPSCAVRDTGQVARGSGLELGYRLSTLFFIRNFRIKSRSTALNSNISFVTMSKLLNFFRVFRECVDCCCMRLPPATICVMPPVDHSSFPPFYPRPPGASIFSCECEATSSLLKISQHEQQNTANRLVVRPIFFNDCSILPRLKSVSTAQFKQ